MPTKCNLYEGNDELFDHYGIEKQIEAGLDKKVMLKSGGSLIIETTEAMTVIDVNTGKFIGKKSLEDTILKPILKPLKKWCANLRLRNIGGLIVIDFIDMASGSNRQKLFKFFEKTLREKDKFQSVVLKISEFGLVQMTRKRSGITLIQQLTETCPSCKGMGFIKSLETQCHELLRKLKHDLAIQKSPHALTVAVSPAIFEHLTAIEYNAILWLENSAKSKITLQSDPALAINQYKILKK